MTHNVKRIKILLLVLGASIIIFGIFSYYLGPYSKTAKNGLKEKPISVFTPTPTPKPTKSKTPQNTSSPTLSAPSPTPSLVLPTLLPTNTPTIVPSIPVAPTASIDAGI